MTQREAALELAEIASTIPFEVMREAAGPWWECVSDDQKKRVSELMPYMQGLFA